MRDLRGRVERLERGGGGDPLVIVLWGEEGESQESLDRRGAERAGLTLEEYRAGVESDAIVVLVIGWGSGADAPE